MVKRMFDITISCIGLIILSPLFLVLAFAIRISSPGTVVYRAKRVGRYGKLFWLYKYRTMVIGADKMGPGITGANDQRVTKIGRLLRKYKLDELPQLYNVFIGDMSFLGPRPEDPRYVAHYTSEQRRVFEVRPGITSLASVAYRNEESMLEGDDWEAAYIHNIMPEKLALDLAYIEQQGLLLDIKIIFRTFLAILDKDNKNRLQNHMLIL